MCLVKFVCGIQLYSIILKSKNIVVPANKKESEKSRTYEGAYVKDPGCRISQLDCKF